VCGTTRETSCGGVCCARFLRFFYLRTDFFILIHTYIHASYASELCGRRSARKLSIKANDYCSHSGVHVRTTVRQISKKTY
jgi:hypothetical protein